MSKHTPLPWKFNYHDGSLTDCSPAENCIGYVEVNGWDKLGMGEANAQLIVTAVNNHAKLVEALRGFVDWSDSQEWRRPGKVLGQRVENARTLLAQLDGELE